MNEYLCIFNDYEYALIMNHTKQHILYSGEQAESEYFKFIKKKKKTFY